MENKNVIARVGNKEITEETIAQFLGGLDPQLSMQLRTPEGKTRIVEELINQELIYLDAIENEMDKEELFLKELDIMKEGLLKQYAVNKIISDVRVSEEEAKAYYDENQDIFRNGDELSASHILVEAKEKAEEIINKIKEGLDFGKAAEENSSCQSKANGGNLGTFGRGMMVPEFEAAAFDLEPGQMTEEPVKTQFGYHIIKLHSKTEGGVQAFEEVKDRLQDQLLGLKQQEAYLGRAKELKEKYEVESTL